MVIRRAERKDIPRLFDLLSQVLEVHAELRPDVFIPGTTKYTEEELAEKLTRDDEVIFVATDENDRVIGYAFCVCRKNPPIASMIPFSMMYIDDLCTDAEHRSEGIGDALVRRVMEEAKERGCYEVTLNVWEANAPAKAFYDRLGFQTKSRMMEFIL